MVQTNLAEKLVPPPIDLAVSTAPRYHGSCLEIREHELPQNQHYIGAYVTPDHIDTDGIFPYQGSFVSTHFPEIHPSKMSDLLKEVLKNTELLGLTTTKDTSLVNLRKHGITEYLFPISFAKRVYDALDLTPT
ncbi:hypothetical protein HOD05_03475 [Candidatus Woesearchaeota archaeon]|jgi:hypothetical protein|nr:hypothetical protein [Candidatus Woesearchaeota archaeon]MBT4150613.1 hypothetical protein [Candidatus Woesearchaeota archaeon]MBT4247831.1 hypothetical protein [Candidatus Woesearchaeota archaeon]MBT4434255.1 hypothetical protein [Candidatus Woesearchaeota archaeon]MBT7331824.1 hypothetical protein [Candidatus Woesearchaeota archaeon]